MTKKKSSSIVPDPEPTYIAWRDTENGGTMRVARSDGRSDDKVGWYEEGAYGKTDGNILAGGIEAEFCEDPEFPKLITNRSIDTNFTTGKVEVKL